MTVDLKREPPLVRRVWAFLYPEAVSPPAARRECERAVRPCPWVGCRHHTWLEVGRSGNLRYALPDVEPWDLRYSCSLDLADAGHEGDGMTLDAVAQVLNLTRERVRQIEVVALEKMRAGLAAIAPEVDWLGEDREDPGGAGWAGRLD